MQSGFIEPFNGSFRRGVLDMYAFRSLIEVREQVEQWIPDYSNDIPQGRLDGLTPAEYRVQNDPATSDLAWQREVDSEASPDDRSNSVFP